MIRCTVCGGRVRPPKLAWTDTGQGIRFYRVAFGQKAYARFLEALAKKVPIVHEKCKGKATNPHLVALDLEQRRQWYQRTMSPAGSNGPASPGGIPNAAIARSAAPANTQNSSGPKV